LKKNEEFGSQIENLGLEKLGNLKKEERKKKSVALLY